MAKLATAPIILRSVAMQLIITGLLLLNVDMMQSGAGYVLLF
jgi:hypothetical protein